MKGKNNGDSNRSIGNNARTDNIRYMGISYTWENHNKLVDIYYFTRKEVGFDDTTSNWHPDWSFLLASMNCARIRFITPSIARDWGWLAS